MERKNFLLSPPYSPEATPASSFLYTFLGISTSLSFHFSTQRSCFFVSFCFVFRATYKIPGWGLTQSCSRWPTP